MNDDKTIVKKRLKLNLFLNISKYIFKLIDTTKLLVKIIFNWDNITEMFSESGIDIFNTVSELGS